jgi:hypothetical protein
VGAGSIGDVRPAPLIVGVPMAATRRNACDPAARVLVSLVVVPGVAGSSPVDHPMEVAGQKARSPQRPGLHLHQGDAPTGAVGVAGAAAVRAVPGRCVRRDRDRGGSAAAGDRCVASQPVRLSQVQRLNLDAASFGQLADKHGAVRSSCPAVSTPTPAARPGPVRRQCQAWVPR